MVATGFVMMMLILAFVGFTLIISGIIGIIVCRFISKRKNKKTNLILKIITRTILAIGIIILVVPAYFFTSTYIMHQRGIQYEKSIEGAADRGDVSRVTELLNKGVNPDECFYKGNYTPLMHACTTGDFKIAKLLIEHGSNVNIEFSGYENGSDKGYTPIFYTLMEPQNYSLVKLLIENRADINHQSADGTTPLIRACGGEISNGIPQLLIKCGADLNHQSDDGTSPLIKACDVSNYKTVQLLIKSGANINAVDKEGKSILAHACNPYSYNHAMFSIIKTLLENGAKINNGKTNKEYLTNLVMLNKDHIKHFVPDYNTMDFGEGVKGFDDNYRKIIDILNKYGSRK